MPIRITCRVVQSFFVLFVIAASPRISPISLGSSEAYADDITVSLIPNAGDRIDSAPVVGRFRKFDFGDGQAWDFKKSLSGTWGVAPMRPLSNMRLITRYVISGMRVQSRMDGTLTLSDNNTAINKSFAVAVKAGAVQDVDFPWQEFSKYLKVTWTPRVKGANNFIVISSVSLSSEPNPVEAHPTAVPTTAPTIAPTAAPTSTPVPTGTPTAACPGFQIEGYGKNTTGGCGGEILRVTNLNDSGAGSLRDLIVNRSGRRIIKFQVAGTIQLATDLIIKNGDVTIDGSDAPAGGVAIKGAGVIVEGHNVILRHLRLRSGPYVLKPDQNDSVRLLGQNIVVDHCSISWGTDENLSITENARYITVQWSIISEGLYNSTHSEQAHSMGSLFHQNASHFTMHHNLYAHNNYRNPQMASRGVLEWVNNVLYNPNYSGIIDTQNIGDQNWVDAIGNYTKPGPNSDVAYKYSWRESSRLGISRIYLRGNRDWNRPNDSLDERLVMRPTIWSMTSTTPHISPPNVTATSAETAYQDVLNGAGATLPCRDAVDNRILDETRRASGGFINYPEERGGWPNLAAGCG